MVAALILAAGLGTRLAPLSGWRAKPLVPIGDRPAIAHIVARVRPFSRVTVVNAHHRAEDVEAFAREAGLLVSREEELLGTAGGLAHAGALLGAGSVLVWNGDMIGELDVEGLLDAHARQAVAGAVATLVVRPRHGRTGNAGLDAGGQVVRLRTSYLGSAREVETADFQGIYVVGEALRRSLPPRGDIIAESFLPAIRAGAWIGTFRTNAGLIDVGTPGAYLDANLRWLAGRGERSWLGEGARIDAGVALDGVVVGAGARIVGAGLLERCVVWPGAEARAPGTDAIVAREGSVTISTSEAPDA